MAMQMWGLSGPSPRRAWGDCAPAYSKGASHVSSGLLLQTPNAYHGASFAEEEPRFAVGEGFFELGSIRMLKTYGWMYSLRNAQDD